MVFLFQDARNIAHEIEVCMDDVGSALGFQHGSERNEQQSPEHRDASAVDVDREGEFEHMDTFLIVLA